MAWFSCMPLVLVLQTLALLLAVDICALAYFDFLVIRYTQLLSVQFPEHRIQMPNEYSFIVCIEREAVAGRRNAASVGCQSQLCGQGASTAT